MNFYYDGQMRRYLTQFVRIFNSFTVQKGYDNLGDPVYEQVPARIGDSSRQVAHILKNNSENTLNTVPFISCYVNSLEMNPDLRRLPHFEETLNVIEKQFDETTHQYVDQPGKSYNVTRYQPVPYMLTMNVDIWTSNTDQKLQLLEQILVLFNPSINLHTTQNVIDWSSLTYCELINTNWSSRSMPQGVDNQIDIATLTFRMPIYINPPVQVQNMNVIHTILTELHTLDSDDFDAWNVNVDSGANSSFSIITLEDYGVYFENNELLLLDRTGDDKGGTGTALSWEDDVFTNYGALRDGISQIRLRQSDDPTDPSEDVIGTLSKDLTNPQKLIVAIDSDTLPSNTRPDITAIINPSVSYPGDGQTPAAATGQRYLVLTDVPQTSNWGNLVASANDIIEYNGTNWIVSFDASANSTLEFVTNLSTMEQFEWNGKYWQNSYEGKYRKGYWRLYI